MKKLACLLLTLLMSTSAALAEDPPVYVALGDSITAGYGLPEGEKCFAEIVALEGGYGLINYGVSGHTVPDILAQLADPAVLADVARAEIITITCGGNDLMAVLYESIAAIYNASVPEEMAIRAGEVTSIMISEDDRRKTSLMLASAIALEGHADMGVTPLMQSQEMAQALADYVQNLTAAITILRSANPDARIILATQYNPYRHFTGLYASINAAMDTGAQRLNAAITECAAALGCETADMYTAFYGLEAELMNAAMSPLNLDFHPNAAGHELIARCMLGVLLGGE